MRSKVEGMVELADGWWVTFGRQSTRIRMVLDFDKGVEALKPEATRSVRLPCQLDFTELEALEVEKALHKARTGHALSGGCDRG